MGIPRADAGCGNHFQPSIHVDSPSRTKGIRREASLSRASFMSRPFLTQLSCRTFYHVLCDKINRVATSPLSRKSGTRVNLERFCCRVPRLVVPEMMKRRETRTPKARGNCKTRPRRSAARPRRRNICARNAFREGRALSRPTFREGRALSRPKSRRFCNYLANLSKCVSGVFAVMEGHFGSWWASSVFASACKLDSVASCARISMPVS